MKFLVIGHYRDSWWSSPPQKQAEIAAASSAFVDKQRKSGKLKELYSLGSMRGPVGIWNFASDEEMGRVFRESPMYAFLDVDVIPIMDLDTAAKINAAFTRPAKKVGKK